MACADALRKGRREIKEAWKEAETSKERDGLTSRQYLNACMCIGACMQ